MMLLHAPRGQRKTLMIASTALMPAIAAGLPGKSVRTESPRVHDKARSKRDTEFT
jgi:hypothetical protein